jgi:hypothetical protein
MDWDHAMTGGTEELVRHLRRLEPAGHAINRDTLMFRAGQHSARRRLRIWQSLAGTMMFLAAGLGWLSRNPGVPAEPLSASLGEAPRADTPAALDPADRLPADVFAGRTRGPANDYLELRRRVTLEGVDALPSSGWAPASPEPIRTIADWLRLPRSAAFNSDPFAFSDAPTKGNLS